MHKHRVTKEEVRPFFGAVSLKQNRAAHGNITIWQTCKCGAIRKINQNGQHCEKGKWEK